MRLLEARAVEAAYGTRRVVDGVSLGVSSGELWAVLGPNGAGKSTLLRACLGLHPLGAGEVELLGRPLREWDRRAISQRVAVVPQSFEDPGGFTVLELVLMGRSPHLGRFGLPSAGDLELCHHALEELGISHLASRPSTALSGGERRMVLLARAFAQSPELLVLDEPTAFLDLRHQVEALARVKAKVAHGLGAIAVLHDVNLAAAFADRVLLLKDGKVVAAGPTHEVLTREALEHVYGIPMSAARAEEGAWLFAPRVTPA